MKEIGLEPLTLGNIFNVNMIPNGREKFSKFLEGLFVKDNQFTHWLTGMIIQ